MIAIILLSALLIASVSLVGVFFMSKALHKWLLANLKFFASFSAGVFFILSIFLIVETFERTGSATLTLGLVLAGISIIWLTSQFIPGFHHHHAEDDHDHEHALTDVYKMLWGDGLHNVADGILLTASFSASIFLGAITALGIFFHELVQEISEFFVLRRAGYSTSEALSVNFAVSLSIFVGVGLSLWLGDVSAFAEVALLGLSSGAFFLVVFYDLIPDSIREVKSHGRPGIHLLWFIIGALAMLIINLSAGH